VNKQQLNESKNNKHKRKKQKSESTQQQNLSQSAQQHKQTADKQLNQQLQDKRQKKALLVEIKQLIDVNKINCEDGDIAYRFSVEGTVKQIYVSSQVQKDLAADKLRVVKYQNTYAVISGAVATKILQRDSSYDVITYNLSSKDSSETEDDSYVGYDVPDDLIW